MVSPNVPPSPPAPGTFAKTDGPHPATVTVIEPLVRIDKDVSQAVCNHTPGNIGDSDTCDTLPGSSYTYTLTITNTGAAPAYDVHVTDAASTNLTNFAFPSIPGVTFTGAVPNPAWTIDGPIAANGGTATITYTASLKTSDLLTAGATVVNTGGVATYFAHPPGTRPPAGEFRTYGARVAPAASSPPTP